MVFVLDEASVREKDLQSPVVVAMLFGHGKVNSQYWQRLPQKLGCIPRPRSLHSLPPSDITITTSRKRQVLVIETCFAWNFI